MITNLVLKRFLFWLACLCLGAGSAVAMQKEAEKSLTLAKIIATGSIQIHNPLFCGPKIHFKSKKCIGARLPQKLRKLKWNSFMSLSSADSATEYEGTAELPQNFADLRLELLDGPLSAAEYNDLVTLSPAEFVAKYTDDFRGVCIVSQLLKKYKDFRQKAMNYAQQLISSELFEKICKRSFVVDLMRLDCADELLIASVLDCAVRNFDSLVESDESFLCHALAYCDTSHPLLQRMLTYVQQQGIEKLLQWSDERELLYALVEKDATFAQDAVTYAQENLHDLLKNAQGCSFLIGLVERQKVLGRYVADHVVCNGDITDLLRKLKDKHFLAEIKLWRAVESQNDSTTSEDLSEAEENAPVSGDDMRLLFSCES